MNRNFMSELRSGRCTIAQIDDWVENWHRSKDDMKLELREFLGMTKEEYTSWVHDSSILGNLVLTQKKKVRQLKPNGRVVQDIDHHIEISIKTRCPDKWALVDMETGEIWEHSLSKNCLVEGGESRRREVSILLKDTPDLPTPLVVDVGHSAHGLINLLDKEEVK